VGMKRSHTKLLGALYVMILHISVQRKSILFVATILQSVYKFIFKSSGKICRGVLCVRPRISQTSLPYAIFLHA
jgi:hypothetical protein